MITFLNATTLLWGAGPKSGRRQKVEYSRLMTVFVKKEDKPGNGNKVASRDTGGGV